MNEVLISKAKTALRDSLGVEANVTYAKGWFTVEHSNTSVKYRAAKLEEFIASLKPRPLTDEPSSDTVSDASNEAGNKQEPSNNTEDTMASKKKNAKRTDKPANTKDEPTTKRPTGKARTKLIRAGDLNFLCVCSPSNKGTGGGIGDGATGKGTNMGMAFKRCKAAADKQPGSKGGANPVFVVYASTSDDLEMNASGHVTATDPVLRLTQLDKDGTVYGK